MLQVTIEGAQPLVFDSPKGAGGGGAAEENPWGDDDMDDNPAYGADSWALQEYVASYQPRFESLQKGGLLSGGAAKPVQSASGLPAATLKKVWTLADLDKDGSLDLQEFVIAMFLIDNIKKGSDVPAVLDESMIPAGKR